jgi:hypothetical protein
LWNTVINTFFLEDPAVTNELPANRRDNNPTPSVSQRLEQLAQRLNEAHRGVEAAVKNGLVCAYEAGKALLEAFDICPKRTWTAWLAVNFKPSRWTARRYMDFALECDQRFGGLAGATLPQIPPEEAGSVLKKLTVLPSGRTKRTSPSSRQRALPSAVAAPASPATDAVASSAAQPSPIVPGGDPNPYLPIKRMFEQLMEGLRMVMRGDDCHDGPFAEMLRLDLEPVYADLLDYLEDRDGLRRTKPHGAV